MKKWILSHNGAMTAPLTETEAIAFLQEQPDSYAWHPSFSQWQPASSVAAFAGKIPAPTPLSRVPDELIAAFQARRDALTERIAAISQSVTFSKTYLYELEQEINIYKRLTHKLSDEVKQGIGGIEGSYRGYQKVLEDLSYSLSMAKVELTEVADDFDKRLEQNQLGDETHELAPVTATASMPLSAAARAVSASIQPSLTAADAEDEPALAVLQTLNPPGGRKLTFDSLSSLGADVFNLDGLAGAKQTQDAGLSAFDATAPDGTEPDSAELDAIALDTIALDAIAQDAAPEHSVDAIATSSLSDALEFEVVAEPAADEIIDADSDALTVAALEPVFKTDPVSEPERELLELSEPLAELADSLPEAELALLEMDTDINVYIDSESSGADFGQDDGVIDLEAELAAAIRGRKAPPLPEEVPELDYELILLEPGQDPQPKSLTKAAASAPATEKAAAAASAGVSALAATSAAALKSESKPSTVKPVPGADEALKAALARQSSGAALDKVAAKAALDQAALELKLAERVAQAKALQEKALQERSLQEKAALEKASSEKAEQAKAIAAKTAVGDEPLSPDPVATKAASDIFAQSQARASVDPVASRPPAGVDKSLFGIDPEAFFAKLSPPPPKPFLEPPTDDALLSGSGADAEVSAAASKAQSTKAESAKDQSAKDQSAKGDSGKEDGKSLLDLKLGQAVKLQAVTSIFKSVFKGDKKDEDAAESAAQTGSLNSEALNSEALNSETLDAELDELYLETADTAADSDEQSRKPKSSPEDVAGRMRRRSRRRG
ncbi:DUF4339 domain-containing protein [Shewanella sp. JM162201]|uniref:DUF4339 domain-containing protein n=1 Tax=Shewanella jiangmenensis TaxID=2837387 RepID=A0ABS5V1Q9_9GAMM|nr:DUF4339 domain-containing protein [Shewanella jiangmenensis]MBT1443536.1 DUF4339 domain-containing protein [Shewanella jiangmenensis]